jgi:VWFA-related protein
MPAVFSEVLDVRVVNLEVVVTDKAGIPLRGLQAADFVLTIDGQEVPIEYFSEVRGGVVAPMSTTQKAQGVAELPALIPGEPMETSYLVFIDELFGIARDRDKVVQSLRQQIARMGPNDRMAIVAYNGEELAMLTTWSQSVPELERVLAKALDRPVYGLRRLAEQRQYDYDRLLRASFEIRTNQLDGARFIQTDLRPDERFFLERLTEQVQSSVTAATMTLRSFAMPPGRKVLLLYSGGWPYCPVSFLGPLISPIVQASETFRGPALFRPLSDTANLLGYTIYPVDMPGFEDLSTLGFERQATTAESLPLDAGFNQFRREQEIHYSLTFLAEETGGRAFYNAGRLTAFEETVSDTRSFYWLGFSPQRDWDDQRHEVKVRVKEPDFRVRSRASFLDSSKQHEVAMALESTLLFGSPPGTQALVVEVGEPQRSGRKRMQVPLTVLFPLTEVTFLPDGEDLITTLELRVAIKDEDGRRAEMPAIPMMVKIQDDPKPGAVGRFETTLRMRRLPHDAVVGVYDPASGRIFTANIEISP